MLRKAIATDIIWIFETVARRRISVRAWRLAARNKNISNYDRIISCTTTKVATNMNSYTTLDAKPAAWAQISKIRRRGRPGIGHCWSQWFHQYLLIVTTQAGDSTAQYTWCHSSWSTSHYLNEGKTRRDIPLFLLTFVWEIVLQMTRCDVLLPAHSTSTPSIYMEETPLSWIYAAIARFFSHA